MMNLDIPNVMDTDEAIPTHLLSAESPQPSSDESLFMASSDSGESSDDDDDIEEDSDAKAEYVDSKTQHQSRILSNTQNNPFKHKQFGLDSSDEDDSSSDDDDNPFFNTNPFNTEPEPPDMNLRDQKRNHRAKMRSNKAKIRRKGGLKTHSHKKRKALLRKIQRGRAKKKKRRNKKKETAPQITKPSKPKPPTFTAKTRDSVTVHWNPPDSDGFSLIERWNVSLTVGEKVSGEWKQIYDDVVNKGTAYTVPSLLSGTLYHFRVRCSNSVGWSKWSNRAHVRTKGEIGTSVAEQKMHKHSMKDNQQLQKMAHEKKKAERKKRKKQKKRQKQQRQDRHLAQMEQAQEEALKKMEKEREEIDYELARRLQYDDMLMSRENDDVTTMQYDIEKQNEIMERIQRAEEKNAKRHKWDMKAKKKRKHKRKKKGRHTAPNNSSASKSESFKPTPGAEKEAYKEFERRMAESNDIGAEDESQPRYRPQQYQNQQPPPHYQNQHQIAALEKKIAALTKQVASMAQNQNQNQNNQNNQNHQNNQNRVNDNNQNNQDSTPPPPVNVNDNNSEGSWGPPVEQKAPPPSYPNDNSGNRGGPPVSYPNHNSGNSGRGGPPPYRGGASYPSYNSGRGSYIANGGRGGAGYRGMGSGGGMRGGYGGGYGSQYRGGGRGGYGFRNNLFAGEVEWQCISCGEKNWPRRDRCRNCGTKKSNPQPDSNAERGGYVGARRGGGGYRGRGRYGGGGGGGGQDVRSHNNGGGYGGYRNDARPYQPKNSYEARYNPMFNQNNNNENNNNNNNNNNIRQKRQPPPSLPPLPPHASNDNNKRNRYVTHGGKQRNDGNERRNDADNERRNDANNINGNNRMRNNANHEIGNGNRNNEISNYKYEYSDSSDGYPTDCDEKLKDAGAGGGQDVGNQNQGGSYEEESESESKSEPDAWTSAHYNPTPMGPPAESMNHPMNSLSDTNSSSVEMPSDQ